MNNKTNIAIVFSALIFIYWYVNRATFHSGFYVNRGASYSVRFPPDWNEMKPVPGNDFSAGIANVQACLLRAFPAYEKGRAKVFFDKAVAQTLTSDQKTEETQINGATAFQAIGGTRVGKEAKSFLAVVLLPKTTVRLQCLAPPDRFDRMMPAIQEIFSSIRVY